MKRLLLVLVLAVVAVSGCASAPAGEVFGVGESGLLVSENRAAPQLERIPLREGGTISQERVFFFSRGVRVAGLLSEPAGARAAAVVLPGAGITKEMEQVGLAGKLNQLGVATLTLDQRGLGESSGSSAGLQQDFEAFAAGREPAIFGAVHDALLAFDALRAEGYEKVWFIGESNGGRTAIIAAAVEPRSAGALGISTGGYQIGTVPSDEARRFVRAVSPESYAPLIEPRPLLLIHFKNDTGIPLESAQALYEAAKEPVELWVLERSYHGYDDTLVPALLDSEVAARLTAG